MNRFFYFVPFILQNLFFVTFLPLYKFFLRLEIKGTENLRNLKGPIILAPNHTSELDPTVIPLIFPFFSPHLPIYSVIYPIAKYKTPEWRWRRYIYGKLFFNLLGGYSSYSGSKDYNLSLKDHILLLNKGRTVCIFPEGKCTTDGNLGPAHGGLGFLTFTTNATVVPLVIDSFYGLSFFEFISRRVKIRITVLPPLTKKEIFDTEAPNVEDFKGASQKVMNRIRSEIM